MQAGMGSEERQRERGELIFSVGFSPLQRCSQILAQLTQNTWGNPRNIYSNKAIQDKESHDKARAVQKGGSGMFGRLKPSERCGARVLGFRVQGVGGHGAVAACSKFMLPPPPPPEHSAEDSPTPNTLLLSCHLVTPPPQTPSL